MRLLLILIFGSLYSYEEGPEHFSWDLGRPDNIQETVVISDPYSQLPESPSESEPQSWSVHSQELKPLERKDGLGQQSD